MRSLHDLLEIIGSGVSSAASYIYSVLNSDFGIAATGSFFGAVGGYVIVMVANRRAEILSKIDGTKVAIALTHGLFNMAYNLNKKHLYDLYQQYVAGKAEFIEAQTSKIKVEVLFNNKTISIPHTDFELLNFHLLRETGFTGRAFILASTLISCLHDLEKILQYRHAVLNEMNGISSTQSLDIHCKACLYYGIKINGQTGDVFYESYSGVMDAIKISVESCIWFSKELALELIKNAEKEAKKIYFRRPKIGAVDYSDVEAKYMPKDEDYKDWREKFKKA